MMLSRFVFLVAAIVLTVALLPEPTSAATTQYVAYSSHTDSACSSTPKQAAYVAQSATTNDCSSTTCVADSSTGLYLQQTCVSDPSARSTTLFGSKPWIQFEIYTPDTACGTLTSVIAYLADGSCISVDDSSASVRAAVYANKTASIATYDGSACAGSATKVNTIPATKLARASCLEGLFLVSTGTATTDSTTTKSHATTERNSPISTCSATMVAVVVATMVALG